MTKIEPANLLIPPVHVPAPNVVVMGILLVVQRPNGEITKPWTEMLAVMN